MATEFIRSASANFPEVERRAEENTDSMPNTSGADFSASTLQPNFFQPMQFFGSSNTSRGRRTGQSTGNTPIAPRAGYSAREEERIETSEPLSLSSNLNNTESSSVQNFPPENKALSSNDLNHTESSGTFPAQNQPQENKALSRSPEVIEILDDEEVEVLPAQNVPRHDKDDGQRANMQSFSQLYSLQNAYNVPQNVATPIMRGFTKNLPPIPGHSPTWNCILPSNPFTVDLFHTYTNLRRFKLSLLSVSEFTITESSDIPNPTWIRTFVRNAAKGYGKAVFEQSNNDYEDDTNPISSSQPHSSQSKGRWRIPLACYQSFYSALCANPTHRVEGIPPYQLNLVSIGRAHKDKEYPTAMELAEKGVPIALALALAPYQRGGVDFVIEKGGKALIADEMGLGKSVQALAAMTVYTPEWPLLIVSPTGARYNWRAEIFHWIGDKSPFNPKKKDDEMSIYYDSDDDMSETFEHEVQLNKRLKIHGKTKFHEVKKSNVHVVASGNDFWSKKTRIVICSYELLVNMIRQNLIHEGQFRCVIVDESHMLKNHKSRRCQVILPYLKKAKRCILLSGTPAFKQPLELLPQLSLLGNIWDERQDEFAQKYTLNSRNTFSEFQALLTSTVMIRRLKKDILQEMPPKIRQRAYIKINDDKFIKEFTFLMNHLRKSKCCLGKIARKNLPQDGTSPPELEESDSEKFSEESPKSYLSRLYTLTGACKVPLLVSNLRKWLSDPTKGKLCIFAHHISMLDAIENGANLKNASKRCFIRIDGSTIAKRRQEQVTAFQTDPAVRIALLGITAAGVAITLTAASNVWFAEMFWTPALMIQAEDRCHRIGQQAQVKCLYFIAKGTLDELLWPLMEKKVRDIGDFVEGKTTTIEVHKDCTVQNDDDVESFGSTGDANEFLDEIQEFAAEEVAELEAELKVDDEDNEVECEKVAGASEKTAICLSDDDLEEAEPVEDKLLLDLIPQDMTNSLLFKTYFWGHSYGLILVPFHGRIIVHQRTARRVEISGENARPHVGDILVAINDYVLPMSQNFDEVRRTLMSSMESCKAQCRPVDLTLCYFAEFSNFFKSVRHTFEDHEDSCVSDKFNNLKKQALRNKDSDPEIIELNDE